MLRTEGYDPDAYGAHQRVPHWDIGAELGLLDGERAAKIAGSMFTMYRGWGARLLRAMVQLSLDRNADAYEEIRPPTLVRTDTMIATGHLPKFEDEAYHMERDDLWAIPTAEVPAHVAAPRRGARRGRPAAALHRPHLVLPARGRRRRSRHARAAARPRVRQGRAPRGGQRRGAGDRVPGGHPRPQRGAAHRARPAVPDPRPLHRRPRGVGGPHLGHRGLRAGLRHVARGELGVVVQRLPGPAGQHPLPVRRRQGHRGVPHRERLGDGVAAHRGGLPRDASPARRLDRDREAAPGLPRRRGHPAAR